MKNRLILAAAGSGKTQYIINEAIKITDAKVLITTYTISNTDEIKKRLIRTCGGSIPGNIVVQTWFSFLLQHGIKPFSPSLFETHIDGIFFPERGFKVFYKKTQPKGYYLNNSRNVNAEKASELIEDINKASKGAVIDRISEIFKYIFIDEVQDLASYDYELVKLLLYSESSITLVGDPRQVTYQTNHGNKNSKYKNKIDLFIRYECPDSETIVDTTSLQTSFRSHQDICALANKLYPKYPPAESAGLPKTGHDGLFVVKDKDLVNYLKKYHPIQLRWNKTRKVSSLTPVFNFAESKGLTFERTLIYPTVPFQLWLKEGTLPTEGSLPNLYVSITRARYSVAVVWDDHSETPDGFELYEPC